MDVLKLEVLLLSLDKIDAAFALRRSLENADQMLAILAEIEDLESQDKQALFELREAIATLARND